ncbi:MAG: hypothetical protein KDA60_19440 [Planctomycetales bacterium]|nr:hypothetical protein [Planctomycetales bacterium]
MKWHRILSRQKKQSHRSQRPTLGHEPLETRQLLAVDGFASFDGFGNNEQDPTLGAAGEQFARLAPAAYEDGLSEPARSDQPNARDISDALASQDESIVNDRFITAMWFQWGQFLDHDINRVFDVAPLEMTSPVEPLDISAEFPFDRSPYDPATGVTSPREHVNHVSAFIDGSVVYGSDAEHALALRTLEGGKMKSMDTDVGELLPLNTEGLINNPPFSADFFVAGDVRVNENIGLTSMQTLWVREHNRLADEIAATEFAGQDLSAAEIDEAIYQQARQMVMGLIQHITYNEFLPSTLGFNAIPTYAGYDPAIDPTISTEFATAAYRLGHSTLSDELLIGAAGDSVPLADAFFRPDLVMELGIDGVLEGLTLQEMQELDNHVVDGVRNFLNDGPGFDLAAINIQRGRDHGLPDFNTLREAMGLDRIDSFAELTSDTELAAQFAAIYGSPDNADPWIAMIAEDQLPGTMTGETVYTYLVDQFSRLRDGDRFYFENALEADQIAAIKATRLSDVIERNTNLDVQDEVFWTRDTLVFRNGLDNEWLIRDFGDNGGAEVVFFGEPGQRDPDNREETIPVRRDEPINAVIVAGTNQQGDGFFIPNALVAAPLADRGIDEFIITADIDFFEGYGLGGNDRWILESDIASVFASGDEGHDTFRVVNRSAEASVELTGGTGNDRLAVIAPRAAQIFVDGGAGNDRINVNARRADAVMALGGVGRDTIFVTLGQETAATVDGQGGQDRVTVKVVDQNGRSRQRRQGDRAFDQPGNTKVKPMTRTRAAEPIRDPVHVSSPQNAGVIDAALQQLMPRRNGGPLSG